MAIKIYVDQGHNAQNPNSGAEGNGLREQDLVWKIGIELAELLNANENFTAKVSRETIDTVLGTTINESLAARVNDANAWGADYFISLHANASEYPAASGAEAFVYSANSKAAPLAESILFSLSEETGLQNRGLYVRPSLYVLRRTKMPALLLENGFITNEGDALLMNNSPELFARGIYNGIVNHFSNT